MLGYGDFVCFDDDCCCVFGEEVEVGLWGVE